MPQINQSEKHKSFIEEKIDQLLVLENTSHSQMKI